MITDIIFDFFGTLVDYTEKWDPAAKNTAHEYLLSLGFSMDKETFTRTFDTCFAELTEAAVRTGTEFHMYDMGNHFFRKCFGTSPAENVTRTLIDRSIDDWNAGVVYFDGIAEFLAGLRENYRLSILSNTNYPDLVHRNLKNMKIQEYFHKVYTSVEIGSRKPNAGPFEFVLSDLKVPASGALFVGDSYNDDFLGATTVGMPCCLIDKKKRYTDYVPVSLTSLFDLPEKLGEYR